MDRDTAVAHPSVRQLGDDRLTTVSEGDRLTWAGLRLSGYRSAGRLRLQ